jgi:phenol 2-monooxygenase (NADPH)
MGAFGMNASILDAANLAWKLGLAVKNVAKPEVLLPTYSTERRKHAVRIIEVSGTYLRFICGSGFPVPNLWDMEALEKAEKDAALANGHTNGTVAVQPKQGRKYHEKSNGQGQEADLQFFREFFKAHGQFLLGVDCAYDHSVVAPQGEQHPEQPPPLCVKHGVRAPNPRVCVSTNETGYLYDALAGPPRFHLVVFASTLKGKEVRRQVASFSAALDDPAGFYRQFDGEERFGIVLVVKGMPFEVDEILDSSFARLRKVARVLYDDRAPDEDAHTTWGVNHRKGAVAVIRPDLWVGFTAFPSESERIAQYFGGFLQGQVP